MRVLVTGASGFLGGALVRRLAEEGHEVSVLARPNSQLVEIADLKFQTKHGDILDRASLSEAMKGQDSVFHLAGLVAYSQAQRPAMEAVNVGGTANVIESCLSMSIRRLVHVSSVVAVGASFDGKTPLDENSVYNVGRLNLGYFETKHRAEELVKSAVRDRGLDAVIICPATTYGPADAKKGSRRTQIKVAKGKFPFISSGGVGVVSHHDVVDALLAAWAKGATGERYIVSAENLLIREVWDTIADCAGVKRPWIQLPKPVIFALGRVGDVMESFGAKGPLTTENAWTAVLYHWFDGSKAVRELGVRYRPARAAIETSVRWMKDNGLLG